MEQTGQAEDTLTNLTRLGQKQGVRNYLVLSRDNGAILRSSGFSASTDSLNAGIPSSLPADGTTDGYANGTTSSEQSAEDVARLVWNFVVSAKATAEGLDGSDAEVKLLRLRTKKNELVIVPDTKFLLVVIHDTPPA